MAKGNEFILLYSLVVLAAGAGVAANAKEPSWSVSYRASELRSAAGTRNVYSRIRRVAANACVTESAFAEHSCRRDLEGQFISRIGSPALLALSGREKRIQLADRGG